MAINVWDTLNQYLPDNPYYNDGEITVGDTGISIDTGTGTGTQTDWDDYLDLSQWVQDGPNVDNVYVLDDFRSESAIPWSWILGGGAVLILFYVARR